MPAHRSALLLLVALALAGCAVPPPAPPTPEGPDGGAPPAPPLRAEFTAGGAFGYVRAQVEDEAGGPRYRVPGTPGNDEVAALVANTLLSNGWEVRYHAFNATYGCEEVAMHNVVAVKPGASNRTLYFAAHYDTRPIAEKADDAEARDEPILGANDGASGVGVLLELGRVLGDETFNGTLALLFFDGEDGGGYRGQACTDWILGSTAFASRMTDEEARNADALILVDLVGDPGLRLPWEMHSRSPPASFPKRSQESRALQDRVYATARALNVTQFVETPGIPVLDDHLPFLRRGIPSVDLIDLRPARDPFPPTHHRPTDTLENISPESLAAVGRVLERFAREWDREIGAK